MKRNSQIISYREKLKQIEIGKQTSFYSALINGWINTRIESDKSILTLSVSAIGLLFTLLSILDITNLAILILFLLAIICFLLCSIVTVRIFHKNADFLEAIANNRDINKNDKRLKIMDWYKSILFFIGLGITFILSLILVLQKSNEGIMSKKQTPKTITKTVKVTSKKSLQGFQNLRPKKSSTESSSNKTTNKK